MTVMTQLRAPQDAAPSCADAPTLLIDTSVGPIRLLVTSDIFSLKERWERLQSSSPCTAAQTYAFAEAWARLVLAPKGERPVIVAGSGLDRKDRFLWPFETRTILGLKFLTFLAQREANYAMGLFAANSSPGFTATDLTTMLNAAGREASAAGALLRSQPLAWDGHANPFARLKRQQAPSDGYAVRLGDFETLYRKRFSGRARSTLKRKEQKLADTAPLDYGWAETRSERLALIDIFFAQKSRQLAGLGIADPFDADVRAFYREMALLDDGNPSRLRLGYLKAGDSVTATFNGFLCHNRFAVTLCSLADGEMQRHSPGSLLLRHQIEQASAQGLAHYDLGIGAARNKTEWCDVTQHLFDQFLAFKPAGRLVTVPFAAWATAKRALKSHPHLWPLTQRWRRILFGRGPASG